MPRRARTIVGGLVYHVLNRSNAQRPLFKKAEDYAAFEQVLEQAYERHPLRILSYCVMPTHWHLVLWPYRGHDQQVSQFMHWLTVTHTQRWHAHHHTSGSGHLYQGRFKSFPVETDAHLLTVCRYVERNARQANLVRRAENWRWSSLWLRKYANAESQRLLSDWPLDRPRNWLWCVNQVQTARDLESLHRCVQRGAPFGSKPWQQRIIERLDLHHTQRPRGRPHKEEPQTKRKQ